MAMVWHRSKRTKAVKVVNDSGSETAEDMPEHLKVVEQIESFGIATE